MSHASHAATRIVPTLALMLAAAGAQAQEGTDPGADLLAQGCMACHGPEWRSEAQMPSLDSLEPAEIARMMREFQSGERDSTIMQRLALGLSDAQIDMLEDYFAMVRE